MGGRIFWDKPGDVKVGYEDAILKVILVLRFSFSSPMTKQLTLSHASMMLFHLKQTPEKWSQPSMDQNMQNSEPLKPSLFFKLVFGGNLV